MIQADTGKRFGAQSERCEFSIWGGIVSCFPLAYTRKGYTPGKAKTEGLGSRLTFCAGGFKTRV